MIYKQLIKGKTVYTDESGKTLRTSKRDYRYALVVKGTDSVIGFANSTSFSAWRSLNPEVQKEVITILNK